MSDRRTFVGVSQRAVSMLQPQLCAIAFVLLAVGSGSTDAGSVVRAALKVSDSEVNAPVRDV